MSNNLLLPCFSLVCVLVHTFYVGTIEVLCVFCLVFVTYTLCFDCVAPLNLTFLNNFELFVLVGSYQNVVANNPENHRFVSPHQ